MTPIEYYREQINKGLIFQDPQQAIALQKLQEIYLNLLAKHKENQSFFSIFKKTTLIKGLYLWGGVGIGKTFLMDCFFHTLPFQQKKRMHFHEFMQWLHLELKHYQGKSDPLVMIAKALSKETMVLCFDEFFVSDITDAMLIGRFLKHLFLQDITLVTTSNVAPDDLYKNGLQREQFLPAIELLKNQTTVLHIPSVIDYRLRHLKEAGVFYTPLGEAAEHNMEESFKTLTLNSQVDSNPISILGRDIQVKKKSNEVVWFEFEEICSVPRSQQDYLAIAKQYHTVFVSNIPIIPPQAKDKICLFICLVDVFYDARVRLVISAEESVPNLYNRGYMILEYTRTNSRLLEMQSLDYFAKESCKNYHDTE